MQNNNSLIQTLNEEITYNKFRFKQHLTPPNDMLSSSELIYYSIANLQALDPSVPRVDLNAYAWIQVTVIDDTDLTYRGKSLSAWFEEERRRYRGGGSDSDSGIDSEGHNYARTEAPLSGT